MYYYEIVVYCSVPSLFVYTFSETLIPGVRVWVPFGPRKIMGVVWKKFDQLPGHCPVTADKIRWIVAVLDRTPVFSRSLLDLAEWISGYYFCSHADALRTILPPGLEKTQATYWAMTPIGCEELAKRSVVGEELKSYFGNKTQLTETTLKKKNCPIERLKRLKLIELYYPTLVARDAADFDEEEDDADSKAEEILPTLTALQSAALSQMSAKLWPDSATKSEQSAMPVLLWGITGAGKTELYLRLIVDARRRFGDDVQILVMVPEISLTPQTTYVFRKRFGKDVSVVHSGLTSVQRWQRLEQVRQGGCRILIGPRSAVFAPFRSLRLIIVDEEHDSSYKQGSGICYNGRDMAILRAKIEGAGVVLGSATPSLESYYNVQQGKYFCVELHERVAGRALPEVFGLSYKPASHVGQKVKSADHDHEMPELPVHPDILDAIRKNINKGEQTIVLVNRRGYSYFICDPRTREPIQCPHCSISLTTHGRLQWLCCHYCDYKLSLKQFLRERGDGGELISVGYGSECAEQFFQQCFPHASIARLDADVVAKKDALESILGRFRNGEIDLLVGTQMLAKGHDFPKVTLTVLLEVDQQLNLPDFRAGEKTFQLIVQASGRSGRHELPGRVLLQSSRIGHPIVQAGMNQDYRSFVEQEMKFRHDFAYPPYSKMVHFELNSEDSNQLEDYVKSIDRWLKNRQVKGGLNGIKVLGPAVPGVEVLRQRHRRILAFMAFEPAKLKKITNDFLESSAPPNAKIKLQVDRDPQCIT